MENEFFYLTEYLAFALCVCVCVKSQQLNNIYFNLPIWKETETKENNGFSSNVCLDIIVDGFLPLISQYHNNELLPRRAHTHTQILLIISSRGCVCWSFSSH